MVRVLSLLVLFCVCMAVASPVQAGPKAKFPPQNVFAVSAKTKACECKTCDCDLCDCENGSCSPSAAPAVQAVQPSAPVPQFVQQSAYQFVQPAFQHPVTYTAPAQIQVQPQYFMPAPVQYSVPSYGGYQSFSSGVTGGCSSGSCSGGSCSSGRCGG